VHSLTLSWCDNIIDISELRFVPVLRIKYCQGISI